MANVLSVVWFIVGCVVFSTGLQVWAALMLPNVAERARQRVERKPVVSFFSGLVFVILTIVIAVSMIGQHRPGPVQLLGWALVTPALAGWTLGAASFALIIADRIRDRTGNHSAMLPLVGGALCNSLGGWLPVVGWFLFMPVTGLISIGAGVMAVLSRREVARRPEAQAVPVAQIYTPQQPAVRTTPFVFPEGQA